MLKITRTQRVLLCDFCSEENPDWLFPAAGFVQDLGTPTRPRHLGFRNDGWTSCEVCKYLIDTNQADALARRCVQLTLDTIEGNIKVDEQTVEWLVNRVQQLHEELWVMRIGEAILLNEYYAPELGHVRIETHNDTEQPPDQGVTSNEH